MHDEGIGARRRRARQARARAGLVAAAVVAALLVGPLAPAEAGPSAYILDVQLTPVDTNGNGLFEYLNVTAVLSPPSAGSYLVAATLKWPQTGTTLASVSSIASLPSGVVPYPMKLDGPTINEKQLDGPYNVTIDLLSSPAGPVADTATFSTSALHAADFERSAEKDKPRIAVSDDAVHLSSPSLNASVNLTDPVVRWQTPPGVARPAAMEARFARVIAFNDDGDHAFEPGEGGCEAPLAGGNWSITALEIAPSADWGSYIRFTLASGIDFGSAACPGGPTGRMSLTFLITQRNATVEGATPFPLRGALEVKVDVRLDLDGGLSATDLAFEVDLRDASGNLSYLVRGPQGYETLGPSAPATNITPLAPGLAADVERVAFIDGDGVVRGHFSWLTLANENLTAGRERFVQVSASQGREAGAMRLFLCVPNDAALKTAVLDPAVGVAPPSPTLPEGSGPVPAPPPPPPSVLVFAASLAAVSAMFFFSIYARAKKY